MNKIFFTMTSNEEVTVLPDGRRAFLFPKVCVLKNCTEAAVQHISGTDRRLALCGGHNINNGVQRWSKSCASCHTTDASWPVSIIGRNDDYDVYCSRCFERMRNATVVSPLAWPGDEITVDGVTYVRKSRESTEAKMTIFVKSLEGITLVFTVGGEDLVKSLKQKIEDAHGMSWQKQHLVFCGRYLKDSDALSDCNISMHSTLHLAVNWHAAST